MAGLGLAFTEIVWAIGTHAEAHALHLALVAILFRVLRRPGRTRRAGPAHGSHWLIAAAVVFGLAVGNHSLTLLLAPAIGLFVLAVEPDLAASPVRGRLCPRPPGDRRPRLPRAAAPCRAVPRAARLRPSRDLGRLLVHRPGRAVPGQPRGAVRGPAQKFASLVDRTRRGVRAARRRSSPSGWSRPSRCGRATPC